MEHAGVETIVILNEITDPDCFRRVKNEELPFKSDAIEEKTGIRSRLIAHPHQTIVSLSTRAVEHVLRQSGVKYRDIGGLVLATCYPGDPHEMAEQVAYQTGIKGRIHGIDRACAGGIAAAELADDIAKSTGLPVVGITTEKLSDMVNWAAPADSISSNLLEHWSHYNDKNALGKASKIFGDATAGFLVKPPGYSVDFDILDVTTYPIANQKEKIVLLPLDGSKDIEGNVRKERTLCINMPGKAGAELMELGPDIMISAAQSMIQRAVERRLIEEPQLPDHLVVHQANGEMIKRLREKYYKNVGEEHGIPDNEIQTKVWNQIADRGNISAASIWYVLKDVVDASHPGELIAVSAVGAGSPGFRRDKLEAGGMLLRRVQS